MIYLKRFVSIFAGFFIFSTASSQEKPKIHMLLPETVPKSFLTIYCDMRC